jgi:hypothetical protein
LALAWTDRPDSLVAGLSTIRTPFCSRMVERPYDRHRMLCLRSDFVPYPVDASRVVANLEAAYDQWLDARQQLLAMPVSMYWQRKSSGDYLAVKQHSGDPGTTLGPRSAVSEERLAEYARSKAELKDRVAQADALIAQRAAQYRALRLPVLPDRQAEILRALDAAQWLRHDVMVVGTNAFAAYSLMCNARFPAGLEETEDFDLAWCRGSGVSLTRLTPRLSGGPARGSLLAVLQGVDASYRINPRKPYQAVNASQYEVELLMAPSLAPLPSSEAFEPMLSLHEQEWLLRGRPVAVVVATLRQRACPLYVPDPRWMALHKIWLAGKPERNPAKRPKDRRQGEVLLSACRYFLVDSYPLDIDFVLELPAELRELFGRWARAHGYDPLEPAG